MSLALVIALAPFVFLAGAFLKGDPGYYDMHPDHIPVPSTIFR